MRGLEFGILGLGADGPGGEAAGRVPGERGILVSAASAENPQPKTLNRLGPQAAAGGFLL